MLDWMQKIVKILLQFDLLVLYLGKNKKWLEEEMERDKLKSKHHAAKATITEPCPKCGAEKMYFWTQGGEKGTKP